ncbi:hypothetical protein ACFSR7_27080 [Cohnella sp. GCM10020058]|uniref:hypothetical protein n=1 Tax=Cohnella sp. GCM10020058 TaxID=3317330 RepID=UPI003638F04C
MGSGKPWFKRLLITAGIVAIVGVGIHWATENEHLAFNREKENIENSTSAQGREDWNKTGDREERGLRGEDGEHEEHDGLDAGAAAGGFIILGGLTYWLVRRRKKSRGSYAAESAPVLPSTSDFLDQWEREQTNKKESN